MDQPHMDVHIIEKSSKVMQTAPEFTLETDAEANQNAEMLSQVGSLKSRGENDTMLLMQKKSDYELEL